MTETKKQRSHKATYSRDKKTGGYLIRVSGPQASAFAGREVPVSRNDGSESLEKLEKLINSGIDSGEVIPADAGKPYALYTFQPKPRQEVEAEF